MLLLLEALNYYQPAYWVTPQFLFTLNLRFQSVCMPKINQQRYPLA